MVCKALLVVLLCVCLTWSLTRLYGTCKVLAGTLVRAVHCLCDFAAQGMRDVYEQSQFFPTFCATLMCMQGACEHSEYNKKVRSTYLMCYFAVQGIQSAYEHSLKLSHAQSIVCVTLLCRACEARTSTL